MSYTGCPGPSPAISAQFILKMCAQQEIAKNVLKPLFGGSRSFKIIVFTNLKNLSPVLAMISSKSVPIWNRFHTIRANNIKITFFREYLSLTPSFKGISLTQGQKFCHKKLQTLRQPTVKILWSYLAPFWYRSRVWQTDRRTPRRWLRRAKHSAIARKN